MSSVQGVQGQVPQNQGPQQQDPVKQIETIVSSAIETMKDAAAVFDTESQAVGKNQLPKYNATQGHGHDTTLTSEAGRTKQTYMPNIDAEKFAGLENTSKEIDAIKKKKKKPGAFEEHLEELASLEGTLDDTSLNTEEKGLIAEFFENLNRIKNLRARLKQLKNQQKHMDDQKEQQKKREQEQQKRQQQQ